MAVSGTYCNVSLCTIQWTGLDGLRSTGKQQSVLGSRFTRCGEAAYSNITTYPSNSTSAVHLYENDCVTSECYFNENMRDITCKKYHHVICNNICRSGVNVAARNTLVNNNVIRGNGGNAITVANDGQSFISSLTGNDVYPMDEGGANDIIAPSSYSEHPVKNATANCNPDIDRIYQQSSTAMHTSLRRFACTIAWLVVACAVFAAGTIFGAMLRLSPGPQLCMRTQFQQPLGQN